MTRRTLVALLACVLCVGAGAVDAATSSDDFATTLVASMKAARVSEGFEVRMNVSSATPGGGAGVPFKLAVVGRFGADRQAVLVRGIAPERIRDHAVVTELAGDRGLRALAYGPGSDDASLPADPFARLFGSDLVAWDLLAPWWDWPAQEIVGAESRGGHDCVVVRSRPAPADRSVVREVRSCVDQRAGIALNTQLFDGRGHLLRSIAVTRLMRTQAGTWAAKVAAIRGADDRMTQVEIYGGDERYQVRPETFGRLDRDESGR